MNTNIYTKWILLAVLVLFSASLVLAQDRAIRVRERVDDAPLNKSQRVALVIGNSNYKVAPLGNPANDARAIAEVLRESGFQVDLLIDANLRKMDKAIRVFGKKLARGGVGLFFYAGHGMQVKGINYLIPIGTKIEAEDEVKYEAVDANRVLSKMSSAQNDLNLVFLDACRNNPFKRSFRSASKGLAPMDAPKGALVSFATAPGNVAADGSGKHSPFTAHLLKQMHVPGLEVGQMMRRVRSGVQQETGGKQTPWELSSMTGNFYFFPATKKIIAKTVPIAAKPAPRAAPPRSINEEEEFWQAVKGSDAVEDLQSYLEAYPKGRFALIARVKIRQLRRKQSARTAAVAPPNTAIVAARPRTRVDPSLTSPKRIPFIAPVAEYPRQLKGRRDLTERLRGKFRFTDTRGRVFGVEYREGEVVVLRLPNGDVRRGIWWIRDDSFCTRYRRRQKKKTRCYRVLETAMNQFEIRGAGSGALVGILIKAGPNLKASATLPLVAPRAVIKKFRLAVFPILTTGQYSTSKSGTSRQSNLRWVVEGVHMSIRQQEQWEVVYAHDGGLNPSAFKSDIIEDKTWTGFFSKSPDKEFIRSQARRLKVDAVVTVKVFIPGKGGTYELYLYDAINNQFHEKSGRWRSKRLRYDIRLATTSFIKDVFFDAHP